jgi:hypothetical protein
MSGFEKSTASSEGTMREFLFELELVELDLLLGVDFPATTSEEFEERLCLGDFGGLSFSFFKCSAMTSRQCLRL